MVKPLKTFRGGIKPPHHKKTAEFETVKMPIPAKVVIPMLQHIGAPCTPIVKKGDRVLVGQKIGDSEAFISAPIHSSVSGTVSDVKPILYPGGFDVMSVEIVPDGLQEVHESVVPPLNLQKGELTRAIKASGLVGLGGAGFPTCVKLSPPPGKTLDILVINGAECEPYITSDYREMIENTKGVLEGTRLVMTLTGIDHAFIGIEINKPEALKQMDLLVKAYKNIQIVPLHTRYPQGGEKQLIYAVTGRKVPAGKLPSDVGVLVHNVNTVAFIADFVKTGMPLIKKKVTVDGGAVNKPMNVEVLIGTPLKEVFEFCGGFKEAPRKVIMGGPMMGVSQFSLDNTVLKQTNALLALTEQEVMNTEESVCIRCGKCVKACPMSLMPLYLNANVVSGNVEETLKYHLNDCIECGSCSYVCPASRHLVQSIRYAKAELRKKAAEKQAAEKLAAEKLAAEQTAGRDQSAN
ncbi:MAG: electron transport complex subunit RsxC [Vallitaleaceae bacterium]|nr:electron transport complex subunit RsxC [Vallitaleaceae bacterium]